MRNTIGMRIGAIEYYRISRVSREELRRLLKGMGVVVTSLTSILLLGGTIYAPKHCTHGVFLWPLIAIGLFLMVVFILGLYGARNDNEGLFACYLVGLFIAILALLGFVIFGYIVIGKVIDLGDVVKARDYNLEDYKSGWLRARVADPDYWATTSACLRDRGVGCKGMRQLVRDPDTGMFVPELSKADRWLKRRHADGWHVMSPIESGCCKPPSSCGFTYVNGTTWTPTPVAGAPAAATNNVDCSRWSNDQQKLCFQCDSCKAGFLDDTRKAWSLAAFFPVFGLMGAIMSCLSGLKFGGLTRPDTNRL